MTTPTSYGFCQLCGERIVKTAASRHVKKCLGTRANKDASLSDIMLIRAQSKRSKRYWLYFGVSLHAQLDEMDRALRRLWLECCDHLSEFYRDKKRYTLAKSKTFDEVFHFDDRPIEYIYDYGSSTELTLTHVGEFRAPLSDTIELLARNEAPVWPCGVCGEAAAYVWDTAARDQRPFLCEEHAHLGDGDMMLPVINSPRMGVCGYTG